jgi:hypothetical protein
MSNTPSVPAVPKYLGYAGLIPFLGLSAGLWFIPQQYESSISLALLAYGAVILSFMGAIHWGVAIELENTLQKMQLGWSVVPALIGWVALLLPVIYGYSILIIAFSALCIVDSYMTKQKAMPPWYPRLRVPLTAVVVLSLISAQVAVALG